MKQQSSRRESAAQATAAHVPDPRRFEASKRVLLIDAFMNRFIKVGGLGVVIAVIGIFVFIVSQVGPMV